MITGPKLQFLARCAQRGYTLEEVAPCVISDDGQTVTVDETHEAYPRAAKDGAVLTGGAFVSVANTIEGLASAPRRVVQAPKREPLPNEGPGTELKKLLAAWLGIEATPGCSCNLRAAEMDRNGCDWCEDNIEVIVGWLSEEATKRRLPFVDAAGRLLVRRAIANARRAGSS